MNSDINDILTDYIDNNDYEQAFVMVDSLIYTGKDTSAAAFIWRGKLHWHFGRTRQAINDYTEADVRAPHGEAAELLRHTMRILRFRNTDMINP